MALPCSLLYIHITIQYRYCRCHLCNNNKDYGLSSLKTPFSEKQLVLNLLNTFIQIFLFATGHGMIITSCQQHHCWAFLSCLCNASVSLKHLRFQTVKVTKLKKLTLHTWANYVIQCWNLKNKQKQYIYIYKFRIYTFFLLLAL